MARSPAPTSEMLSQLQAAVAKHKAGDIGAAERIYRSVIDQAPGQADALHLLGLVLHQKGINDESERLIERAIAVRPKQAEFHYNLGKVRAAQEKWLAAADANKAALDLKPDYADAHCNLGVSLLWQGRLQAAEEALRKSIDLNPNSAATWSALGLALRHQDRKEEADKAWEKAISLQPDFAEAQYNLATSKLSGMNFAEGWAGFAWRGEADPLSFDPQSEAHPFSCPRWQGEPLDGKAVFLWGEQGLGDQILFSGLVPELVARAGKVFLECEPRLVELFERSFPDATVVPRQRPVGDILSKADIQFQCPLGDIGKFLRPDTASFKDHGGYLKPDPARVSELKTQYKKLGSGGPVVGLSWRSPRKRFGALKSTDLAADWGDVLSTPGVTFVSLQYGPTEEAIARAEQCHGVRIHKDSGIDATDDIDALAAQIAAMDLVVSISNTTVHLAGGLGVPVWTIVPSGAGRLWYWFNGLDRSPWYPSMRLFQQETPGSWGAVMGHTAKALKTRFGRTGDRDHSSI